MGLYVSPSGGAAVQFLMSKSPVNRQAHSFSSIPLLLCSGLEKKLVVVVYLRVCMRFVWCEGRGYGRSRRCGQRVVGGGAVCDGDR